MSAHCQVMPPLTASEYQELRADIETHGVQEPIVVTDKGEIVDGHTRDEIARKLKVSCPQRVVSGYTDAELRDMAFRLNLHRRHLTREQKRDLVANSVKADPQLSDNEHAKRTGVSHSTVGAVRDELEAYCQIGNKTERVESSGRQARGRKPTTQQPKSEPAPENITPQKEPRVNKRHAAIRAEEDAIAESVRNNGSGMVVASRRTPRVVAATDRLMAALNQAAIAISRAMNDTDLDVEFMRAQGELNPDAQLDTVRRDLRRRIDDLGRKLRELREAAQASSAPEESAARQ